MKTFLTILLFSISLISKAQNIELIKFDDLKSSVSVTNDTLYVLNFWATWCKPCVQELPYFEKCNSEFKNKKIKIILVNLDFNSQVQSSAVPFIQKKKIHSKVFHITDTDPNSWINKVDSSWSGAIPATIIYKNGKKIFFKEGSVKEDDLREEIIRMSGGE